MDINEKLLYLMEQLYNMSEIEKNDFLNMLEDFSDDEKYDLGIILMERIEKEKSMLNRLVGKIKSIFNKEKEEQDKLDAEKLLLSL